MAIINGYIAANEISVMAISMAMKWRNENNGNEKQWQYHLGGSWQSA